MLRYLEGQTLAEFVSRTASEVSPWRTKPRRSPPEDIDV
jgi:hypothetical protein